jgi:hypothetical protein
MERNVSIHWGVNMKTIQVTLIAAIVIACFVCGGLVDAQSTQPDYVSTVVFLSLPRVQPLQTENATIIVYNNSTQDISLSAVGIHFDWMDDENVHGYDLTGITVIIPAGGNTYFPPISTQIPINATAGNHTYYIAVDGMQGSNSFSYASPPVTLQVYYGNTPTPILTPTPTGNQGGQGGDVLLYIAGIAIAAVIALFIVLLVLKRKNRSKPVSENQPNVEPVADRPSEPAKKDESTVEDGGGI